MRILRDDVYPLRCHRLYDPVGQRSCGASSSRKRLLEAYLDLKPALSFEQLDARILREFEGAQNRQFKNVIGALFPASLTPVMLRLGKIAPEKRSMRISRRSGEGFVRLVKAFPLPLRGLAASGRRLSQRAASP